MLELNLFEIFIAAMSMQGILFSLFLLLKSKRETRKQNISLSIFIFVFSIILFNGWLIGSGSHKTYPSLLLLPIFLTFSFGPSFYFYVCFVCKRNYSLKGKELFHLILPIVQIAFHIYIFLRPIEERVSYFYEIYLIKILAIEEITGILLLFFYILKILKALKHFKINVLNNQTDPLKKLTNWIRNSIIAISIILLSWASTFLLDFTIYDYRQDYSFYYPSYFMIALMVNWIIYQGFFSTNSLEANMFLEIRNKTNSLKKEEVAPLLRKLKTAIHEEKLHLIPKITLNEFSDRIEENPKKISMILNNELKQNFYEFINSFRVEKAKEELISDKNSHLTIEAISKKCGFNSKSSFHEVFKKFTNKTPSNYIKLYKEQPNLMNSKV